jgi:hypothetical protein
MRGVNLTRAGVAAVAAIGALAAGCGDDDETTDATGASGASGFSGTALTEEEFVDQGNAICADVNSQIEALQAPSNDLQSVAAYADEGLAIVEPALDQFRALVPPEDIQDDWDAYLDSAEEQIDLTKQLQVAAEAGDTQEAQSILQDLNELDNNGQARELGLTECAKNPTPQG